MAGFFHTHPFLCDPNGNVLAYFYALSADDLYNPLMQKYNVPVFAHTATGDLLGFNPSTGDWYWERGLYMDPNLEKHLARYQITLKQLIDSGESSRKAAGVPAYSPYG